MATPTTYTVVVTFTVDPAREEHLRSERAVRDEVRSWLESLRATIRSLSVRKEAQS